MGLGIPPSMLGLLCLANLAELVFSLALFVDWVRNWRHVKVYWAYGLGTGLGVLGFGILQTVAVALTALPAWNQYLPPGWESTPAPSSENPLVLLIVGLILMALGVLAIVITVTRVAGFTMLGMHYADELGHPSFPLLQRLFGARSPAGKALPALAGGPAAGPVAGPLAGPLAGGEGTEPLVAADSLEVPAAAEPPPPPEGAVAAPPVGKRWRFRSYALSTVGAAAAAIVYSVVLFRLASPHTSQTLSELPSYTPEMVRALTPAVLVTVVAAALSEELTYRLGIQGFLARYLKAQGLKYWLPVVFSALLWTLQHAGAMEPGWVKLAQIFPIGLMLGWLYRRHGIESCILAHALFNLGLAPLSSFLVGM